MSPRWPPRLLLRYCEGLKKEFEEEKEEEVKYEGEDILPDEKGKMMWEACWGRRRRSRGPCGGRSWEAGRSSDFGASKNLGDCSRWSGRALRWPGGLGTGRLDGGGSQSDLLCNTFHRS